MLKRANLRVCAKLRERGVYWIRINFNYLMLCKQSLGEKTYVLLVRGYDLCDQVRGHAEDRALGGLGYHC
jgi:hypothetical protein